MSGLPPGTKVCPGWSSEFSPETGVDSEGYMARYNVTKASGAAVKYHCGQPPSGRSTDPSVIRDGSERCERCRRQKAKYDQEHGLAERQRQEIEVRYNGLIDAYVRDVKGDLDIGPTSTLGNVLGRVDVLTPRSELEPFARRGEDGFQTWYNERDVGDDQKLDVLRSIAGLPRQMRRIRR